MKRFPANLSWLLLLGLLSSAASADQATLDKPLSKEAVFQVLAAEFSIYRNRFDQAQHYYLAEAREQKDAYLAERATRLSMYNKHYVDMLEAALIWQQAASHDVNSHFFVALAYGYNGQPNIALEHMRRVLSRQGETDFTRLVNLIPKNHASERFYQNELFQAFRQYPKSYDLALALAILHNRQDDDKTALAYVDKAVALADSDNTAVIDYSVRLYLKHQQPQKALEVYRKAIEKNPDDLQLRHTLAQLAMRHDLNEARQQLQYLLGHSPDDDYIIMNLGLIYLDQGETAQAAELFQLLLKLQKRISSANYYLGLIYRDAGDFENALASFLAVNDKKERLLAQEQIIALYIDKQFYAEAMARINNGLAKTTDNEHREKLYLLKAGIYEKQGDIGTAYQLLTQLLNDNPDSIELRYNRAMLAETEDKLPQMESDLRHIISIQPNSVMALNALGYTLANKTDRYREALQLIEQAYQLLPDDPAILDSLGWVLHRMGRTSEALAYLQHAMDLYPDAEIAAHLGEVLWALGRKQDAEKVFLEALNMAPDHRVLNETIRRLNIPRTLNAQH